MKTIVALLGSLPVLSAGLFAVSGALAQDEQAPPPDQAPPPSQITPSPPSAMPPAAPDGAQVQAQYTGPGVWYGYHGVAPRPYRPSFGGHWGGHHR